MNVPNDPSALIELCKLVAPINAVKFTINASPITNTFLVMRHLSEYLNPVFFVLTSTNCASSILSNCIVRSARFDRPRFLNHESGDHSSSCYSSNTFAALVSNKKNTTFTTRRRCHSSIDTPRVRMMKFIGGLIEILSPFISPVSLLSIVSHVDDQWRTTRFSWNRTRICGLRIIARDVDVIIVSSIADVEFLQQNDDFTTVLKTVLRVSKIINTSCCLKCYMRNIYILFRN